MTQSPALADRLRPMAGKLIIWRAEAERIRLIAMEASERRTADPAVLEGIEETAGALYKPQCRGRTRRDRRRASSHADGNHRARHADVQHPFPRGLKTGSSCVLRRHKVK